MSEHAMLRRKRLKNYLAFTGMSVRRCKVVILLNTQIDFNSGWINIPQKKAREKNARPVKMTNVVRQYLAKILKKSNADNPFVFTDENGNPCQPNWISVAFGRACNAAGIQDIRYHELRHNFATRLINADSSLYQIRHQLSRINPRNSQQYTQLLPENQNGVERIDGTGTTTILLHSKGKELQPMP